MDELPADAEVTVHNTRSPSGDAMSHRADPAELFDIEMDELRDQPPGGHRQGSTSQTTPTIRATTFSTTCRPRRACRSSSNRTDGSPCERAPQPRQCTGICPAPHSV